MKHFAVKANVAEITDLGEFTALAATYDVDRVNDRIVPGAFGRTIAAWRKSGKRVPLHWNHSGDAKDIIGSTDPAAMRETDEGLYVEGRLDLTDSEVAREAWRSMKSNGVALSFGYKVDRSHKGSDGVTLLDELDLFEVSVTPGPANPETRFLSLKAALAVPVTHPVPTNAELLAYAKRLGVEPPVPSSRLRRHGDDTAFAVALGETRGALAKRVAEQPPSKAPNTREQRRRADDERLAMALGEAPPQAKDTVVRIDDDYVKTKSESYRRMLAVLQGDN